MFRKMLDDVKSENTWLMIIIGSKAGLELPIMVASPNTVSRISFDIVIMPEIQWI